MLANRVIMGSGGVSAGDATSYLLDGTGDYLSIPSHADWTWGTGNFTVDGWIYITDLSSDRFIFAHNSVTQQYFGVSTTGVIVWLTAAGNIQSATGIISLNTWHHVVAVREGTGTNQMKIYVDGVQVAIGTNVDNYSASTLRWGSWFWNTNNQMLGNLDEMRISNTARWTANFTPPTEEYISDANTKLLIHCGEAKTGTTGSGATFTDSGNTGHTVTEAGNAIEDTTTYKF